MNLPTLDKVLVCLLILPTAAIWSETARAEPAPVDDCDNKCRERRFYKNQTKTFSQCVYNKYRDCLFCTGGKCKPNMVEDTHTAGMCVQSHILQRFNLSIMMCNEMCPFPPEAPEVSHSREAAEQPGQYAGIAAWENSVVNVLKCFIGNGAKSWGDEKDEDGKAIEWKKKS